jgi:dTDP-4-amino-4,6-dideoxygalactose transaminase
MRPKLPTFDAITPFLKRIDENRIYSNRGPLVCELEESYSRYLKVDRDLVVALANATQAIQGLVSISKNQNWIVPNYTFSATGLAVLNTKKTLHLCDVRLEDWKIDFDLFTNTEKNFGIIPVMPFGSQIEFQCYKNFEDVIFDAAASLGSTPPNFAEMSSNWSVVYSLHATKVLGAGEGAIVVCGNTQQASSLRAWSNFGFTSDRNSEFEGTNAKLSEVHAAYGLYSLNEVENERTEWMKSQEFVALKTRDLPWTTFVNYQAQFHPYWIASFADKNEKDVVIKKLNLAGIQTREWWGKPLSFQQAFSKTSLISKGGIAELLSDTHLGLPMYRELSLENVSEICDVVGTALGISK